MAIYQAKDDFTRNLARVGLRKAEAARRAQISRYTVDHVASGRQNASETTALQIAAVYADAAGISQDEAIQILFVLVADRKGPERKRGVGGKFIKETAPAEESNEKQ